MILMVRSAAISAFTRVHSPSQTGVNALADALWLRVSNHEGSASHRAMSGECRREGIAQADEEALAVPIKTPRP
jgi:hypothetical protein